MPKLNIQKSHKEFEKEAALRNLLECVSLAEKVGLSMMSMEEVSIEVKAVRNIK